MGGLVLFFLGGSVPSKRKKLSPVKSTLALTAIVAIVVIVVGFFWVQRQQVIDQNAAVAADYTPPPIEPDPIAVMFGDSWTNGSEPVKPQQTFTAVAGQLLGYDVAIKGHGGTGFLADRTVEPATPNFQEQIAAGELDMGRQPELVIVQGGLLDQRYEPEQVSEAATSVLTSVRGAYPDAHLFLIGPANIYPERSAGVDRVEAALAETAEAMDIPFISMNDLMERETLLTMLGEDEVHPTQDGHRLLGEQLATVLTGAGVEDHSED